MNFKAIILGICLAISTSAFAMPFQPFMVYLGSAFKANISYTLMCNNGTITENKTITLNQNIPTKVGDNSCCFYITSIEIPDKNIKSSISGEQFFTGVEIHEYPDNFFSLTSAIYSTQEKIN
jgi:hypothetical protein